MYREDIDNRIANAMKESDKLQTNIWRDIKNEFIVFRTAKAGNVLDDATELKIINKMYSSRIEAMEIYRNAGREDLATNEECEAKYLKLLLPKEPTEEEITAKVKEAIGNIENPSMKNMKEVLNFVKQTYPTVNGGVVSKIFKNNLN